MGGRGPPLAVTAPCRGRGAEEVSPNPPAWSRSSDARSSRARPAGGVRVLVVAAQPEDLLAFLVAPHRRTVEEAVVAHRRFEAARGGHVGSVDGAVRLDVCAQ